MKILKSLLLSALLLTATLVIAALSWSWQKNTMAANPLPIPASHTKLLAPKSTDATINTDDANLTAKSATSATVCAHQQIQPALDHTVASFEYRYPNLRVDITYTDLPQTAKPSHWPSACPIDQKDMLLFAHSLSSATQAYLNNRLSSSSFQQGGDPVANLPSNSQINESPNLQYFNYTVHQDKRFEGALLSTNPTAIKLRNYLLSSMGQDDFAQFGFDSIDGYTNRVGDLFNPRSD